MAKLTFKQAEKLHKALWGWLAETGAREKDEWPEWKFNKGKVPEVSNDCFACEIKSESINCNPNRCPIDWGYDSCLEEDSPYLKWGKVPSTVKTRKKYAAIIRDLPWRKIT